MSAAEIIPICEEPFPSAVISAPAPEQFSRQQVLRVALNALPVPDEASAWQDIVDFKYNLHDKQWDFRRFLRTLASKKQTEAETRDDIEWTLNEYAKAMKLHNLKAGNSFVEVYLMPVVEIIEDVAKFNWSKLAKGALSVTRHQIELMEAEMKAPGKECAYVFDARKRFGA